VYFRCVRALRGLSGTSMFLGLTGILITIAHSPGRQMVGDVSCCGQIPHGVRVNMAGSVRDDPKYQVVLAAEEPTR
jgi:hypothetical protein